MLSHTDLGSQRRPTFRQRQLQQLQAALPVPQAAGAILAGHSHHPLLVRRAEVDVPQPVRQPLVASAASNHLLKCQVLRQTAFTRCWGAVEFDFPQPIWQPLVAPATRVLRVGVTIW